MRPTTLIGIAIDVDSQGDKGSSATVIEGAFQLMGSDVKKLLSHWPIQLALTLYRKELVRFKKKYGTDDLGAPLF